MTQNILLYASLVGNVVLEWAGFRINVKRKGKKIFIYYTEISNFINLISASLMLYYLLLVGTTTTPSWIIKLRFLSASMLLMTAFITVGVLIPMGGSPRILLFSGHGLYHHTLAPILSILSYLFIEPHVSGKNAFLDPVVVTFLYGSVMITLNYLRKVDGPYPFLKVYKQTPLASALWFIVIHMIIMALSWFMLSVSQYCKL